ncbi:MAG TPA: hypothetical protein VHE30_18740 [Polyangiaceae bacterium]|nr:hypothetical protein [Polyangiaceae bacterium]
MTAGLVGCSGKTVNLGGKEPVGSGSGGAGSTSDGGGTGGGGVIYDDGGTPIPVVPNQTGGIRASSKLDLLLVVDNSISMADKQKVLEKTVPDLIRVLTSVGSGVNDLHVGVITSSLGDHGDNNTCPSDDTNAGGDITREQQDDHAHLVPTRPRGASLGLPDVLSWSRGADSGTLVTQVQGVVAASSEFGCGLESQLESMYRFLADPAPPASIEKVACPGTNDVTRTPCAQPTGLDSALLAQRAEFLRPDSAVGIVLLTDENDCSIRDTQQFFYAARQDIVLPNAASVCATNPNDPCCYSCAASPPAGCAADPACTARQPDPNLDPINLRCFNEKQRFGLDFLYPVQRYVNALSKTSLCKSRTDLLATDACPEGDLVDNPLFVQNGVVRDPSMVYLLGIVGVPWQDLATPGSDTTTLAFKTPAQLASDGSWNVILGRPGASPPVLPTDGLMMESRAPRNGSDITGAPIPGPNASLAEDNAMNGHDWNNLGNDDLMYACTFALTEARNCSDVEKQNPSPGCDCGSASVPGDNNPLCRDPATGAYGSTQFRAKAYPGLRELAVLQGLGNRGLAASICTRNTTDDSRPDYGYRPALDLLLGSLAGSLQK